MANLNLDDAGIRTSAIYSTQDAQWNHVQSQSQRDCVAYAIDNIFDTIGAENIKLFLPMWETSGTTVRDLLNRDLTFTASGGVTLAQSGPFGYCMLFDGSNDYLRQDPVTDGEATTETSTQTLAATGAIAVQKMKVMATNPAFVRLGLIKAGSPDGSVYCEIRTAKDSAPITNGTSATLVCSDVGTSAQWRGFTFATPPNLQKDTIYYLAIMYSGNTNADGANNIGWRYDSAGGYGQGRHYYNGAAWTDTAGEDHAFGVWSKNLMLSEDCSVIALAKDGATNMAYRHIVRANAMVSTASTVFSLSRESSGNLYDSFGDGTMRYIRFYRLPTEFFVMGLTVSKAKSTNKGAGFYNGVLESTANGTANAALIRQAQPIAMGCSISYTGGIDTFWQGNIGPVIITSNELSAAQVGKVSHELLCLRKFGVAV